MGDRIAALYVATNGCYFGLDGVDPYDITRDARKYAGPHPVVAHPPCERWGRYWDGGPSKCERRKLGDDDGCFAAALTSVRRWGGVIEHPEGSRAWRTFGLSAPPRSGGWVPAGDWLGWTCCVEQGHYGHRARKATWLYVVGSRDLPTLVWGPSVAVIGAGETFATDAERRRAVKTGACQRMSRRERRATPLPFRDLLISIARNARAGRAAA